MVIRTILFAWKYIAVSKTVVPYMPTFVTKATVLNSLNVVYG